MTATNASGEAIEDLDGLTNIVAAFASTLERASVNSEVCSLAENLVAATLNRALNPRSEGTMAALTSWVEALNSPPEASILSSGRRIGGCYAALLNGCASHVPSATSDRALIVGVAAAIVPAAFAMAECNSGTTDDLVEGVIVGIETSIRLAIALGPEHVTRGWSLDGTVGHVGAAVAAARGGRLDASQTAAAVGFAGTQAAGLARTGSADVDTFIAGKSAADGVEAALLARAGLTTPPAPLEGRRGLFALEGGGGDGREAFSDLGGRWALLGVDWLAHFDVDDRAAADPIAEQLARSSSMADLVAYLQTQRNERT